jgi:Dolichyl-phosphate-mannose-protein mannosyltransferase
MGRSALCRRAIVLATVGTAVCLRLWPYTKNPSLSTDEAQLALNITDRSIPQLLDRLDFNQGAPPGFLVALKAAISALGNGELALRALPLVAAVVAVGVFYAVARNIVGRRALVIALAVFSTSAPLILFGTTAKPYSMDALVALILYFVGIRALRRRRLQEIATFGAVGAVSVWISYPAVFFLAGIALILAIEFRNDRRPLLALGVTTLALAAVFGGSYLIARAALGHLKGSLNLVGVHPFAPSQDLEEFLRSSAGAFRYLLGIGHLRAAGIDIGEVVAIIFAILFLAGFGLMFRASRSDSFLVAAPLFIAALGVIGGLYPIYPRTLLFATPALIMFVSVAIAAIIEAPNAAWRFALWPILITLLAFVVAPGIKAAVFPSEREALRPVMKSLAERAHDDEGLYVYYLAQYGLGYYVDCRCFASRPAAERATRLWPFRRTRGSDQWAPALRSLTPKLVIGRRMGSAVQDQIRDLARLPRRAAVWIILADMTATERALLLGCLNRVGTRRRTIIGADETRAARAYLYLFEPNVSSALPAAVRNACL